MVLIKYDKKEIQVIDQGIGISDNEKAKVFNRFYQVEKSRTNHTGNGIGLAIAQQYAQIINNEGVTNGRVTSTHPIEEN
ncbi:TMAO reductase sytem sensor TorS, torS [Lactococcus cremoris]|nr:TMAO reductase sytem sensor TorS, torS [Lactococcus cremoris]